MEVQVNDLAADSAELIPQQGLERDEVGEFQKLARQLINEGKVQLKLNLAQVPYIDSAGLGSLIGLKSHAQAHQGSLTITALHPRLREIFLTARLDIVFGIELGG